MSYVVDVTYTPKWYLNAWCDAVYKSAARGSLGGDHWARLYPDYVYNWGGYAGPTTVTFPDEQSYTWFVLRWS